MTKLKCIKKYDFDNVTIEVGEIIEVVDGGEHYEFNDENSFHLVSKEEDDRGISYKTWFIQTEEESTNE